MSRTAEVIAKKFPRLAAQDYARDFPDIGVDSFDLVELRVLIEQRIGRRISDAEWMKATSLASIVELFDEKPGAQ